LRTFTHVPCRSLVPFSQGSQVVRVARDGAAVALLVAGSGRVEAEASAGLPVPAW
jgi:hypothetical protein